MYKRAVLIFFLLSSFIFSSQPVQAQEASGPIYIVQAGDNLSSIAARFSVSVTDLMSANNITNPNQLKVGQQLTIPGLEGVVGLLNMENLNFGDSYRSLMRRSQISPDTFQKLNHVVSPNEFYVGVSMIVPANDNQNFTARVSASVGESLLELAVKQNTDPWTLAHYNGLQGSYDGLPGDTLVAPGKNSEQKVSGLPPAFVSAEMSNLPVKQGGVGVVKVKTLPGVTLSGNLVDRRLHFFPMEDGTQVALQGVHALLPPGVYPLRLDATLPDGSAQSYEQSIVIVSGNYANDPLLSVEPATIDPAVTEPELQQLIQLTAPSNPIKYWDGDFISPAVAYAQTTYVISKFGNRRIYLGKGTDLKIPGFHTGMDFSGGVGLAITAPAAGKVIFAGPLIVRGNATIIDHGWGVYSGYWHQSEFKVKVGDLVEKNQIIGLVGGTGRVTGAHLHWEIWVNGVQVDPMDWLTNTYP